MGENVITTDGDVWRRHRRITAPAFNQSAYEYVWETTAALYEDMLRQEGWKEAKTGCIVDINVITHKVRTRMESLVGVLNLTRFVLVGNVHYRDMWFRDSDVLERGKER